MAIQRTQAVQTFVDVYVEMAGISPAFQASSDHPYSCRCINCLRWWAKMPNDENEDGSVSFGPFTLEEVAAAREALKKEKKP